MTREDVEVAIAENIKAGALKDLGAFADLKAAAPLVELHLTQRIAPLRPWMVREGIRPLNENDLSSEIRAEFKRLFDQIQTPPPRKVRAN